ncbi:MAG: glycosyltransferase family 9 protein [Planctomycetota bacterium]
MDLALLKPLIKRCDVLITNDTGPRHYAVAFNVPVVAIMGPTDPRYTAANLEKTVVIRQELECSPCHKKVCPIDHPTSPPRVLSPPPKRSCTRMCPYEPLLLPRPMEADARQWSRSDASASIVPTGVLFVY